MEETIFLNEGGVTVTNTRFLVPSETFAISGITSVKASEQKPNRTGPFICILIGLFLLLGVKLIGLIFIGIGGWWLKDQKSEFHVVLKTASGEAKALSSRDRAWINKVIAALNASIVHRG